MRDLNIDTIKYIPEEEKEVILHLTEIFEGEEEIVNEYVKNELINK
ncbi:hypothetical protein [Clostridium saccharobutylicum]|uniref:Uncharacterized protein n=1 Tax=Clostridium saccharobutylicum DSM 13864 TaxID=1345695 RepID=U5MTE4_CLOSA|nr:hypothetical protein [Clostridium saccharobutylicum]AGX42896.1 hypothetical protein CLSA_c19110 [Clostridium saccharobutylicum DSM 13864]AQR90189.1 hypothetical protein CLOSC_19040 [Clostridium saccharobutylicum]AQS00095.1 hypothetical protein CSACC_19110 [Clostridium saccharobutylicum]AQS09882.1 hypothetical protein CLOBY_20210 [Clostridium saccharobutylicum]AQS14078.1 hypothetical protein CLOSACC_19110 [Clostridium saccharobutylicum]